MYKIFEIIYDKIQIIHSIKLNNKNIKFHDFKAQGSKRKKKGNFSIMIRLISIVFLLACANADLSSTKRPTPVVLWHGMGDLANFLQSNLVCFFSKSKKLKVIRAVIPIRSAISLILFVKQYQIFTFYQFK